MIIAATIQPCKPPLLLLDGFLFGEDFNGDRFDAPRRLSSVLPGRSRRQWKVLIVHRHGPGRGQNRIVRRTEWRGGVIARARHDRDEAGGAN